MFSVAEKRRIAAAVEDLLLELHHPEMPADRPSFTLHVDGAESWSWADIMPNWKHYKVASDTPVNPWNEVARQVMDRNK